MSIVYLKDPRSNITYAYEQKSYWDKEKKQSRSHRKLIGRLNDATGEIEPTDGRCRFRSPSYNHPFPDYVMPKTNKELKEEILRLLSENHSLKEQLSSYIIDTP